MELDRRAIEIRPRSAWEACDLGIQMGRHWWWPMVKIWLALAAPWVVLSWCLPARFAMYPAFLYWLGKPLWERFLLYFLSQAIFAQEPSTGQVLKCARQLLAKDCLASLLWRRLSLWRAYNCALTVLEGQTGKGRRQRLQHLAGDNASTASKVAILLAHMEGFLLLSLLILVYSLAPRELDFGFGQLHEWLSSDTFAAGYNTLYIVVSSLVAPFFVATGFALYLNRRIWLEAWDIDISFRTLAKRLSPPLLMVLICSCLWAPTFAPHAQAGSEAQPQAAPSIENPSDISQALDSLANPALLFSELQAPGELMANYPAEQAKIAAVLAGEDFHRKESRLVHHWRWDWQRDSSASQSSSRWVHLIAAAARSLEILLWVLVLALVVWLAFNYRKLLERFGTSKAQGKTQVSPQIVFGLDVRPGSLPDNPAAVALDLCLQEDYRQCLALLYRATLAALIQQGLHLKPSHTEEDCLRLAGALSLPADAVGYLQQLTGTWQQLAYGHMAPTAQAAEQLCRRWPSFWSVKGAADV